jgi:hypothetical protein
MSSGRPQTAKKEPPSAFPRISPCPKNRGDTRIFALPIPLPVPVAGLLSSTGRGAPGKNPRIAKSALTPLILGFWPSTLSFYYSSLTTVNSLVSGGVSPICQARFG